jgi:predicted nucleic acid-binding protein
MSTYVLDTSALLAYIEDEEGATTVEQVLMETLLEQHTLYISIVSCIEVFYISFREQGQVVATERLQLLRDLPFIQEPLDDQAITVVGELKAGHAMSFADCCIAGLAQTKGAILMHKDPEFDQLPELPQQKLPYKKAMSSGASG